MIRLHDRHASGEGFEDEQAFRLAIGRRHGEHVDATQKVQFPVPVDFAGVLDCVGMPGIFQSLQLNIGVFPMLLAEPTGDLQASSLHAGHLLEQQERIDQQMQAFLRREPREIADG